MLIRKLAPPDREDIEELLRTGGTFNEVEVTVAMEVVDAALAAPGVASLSCHHGGVRWSKVFMVLAAVLPGCRSSAAAGDAPSTRPDAAPLREVIRLDQIYVALGEWPENAGPPPSERLLASRIWE